MDDLKKKISTFDASELEKVLSLCKTRRDLLLSISNLSLENIELEYFENDKYLVFSSYKGVEICKYENKDVINFVVEILNGEYEIYTLKDKKINKVSKCSFDIGTDTVLEMLKSFSNPPKEATEKFEKILKLKTDVCILKNTF